MRTFLLPLIAAAGMAVAVGNVVQAAELPFPTSAIAVAPAGSVEAPTVQPVYYGGYGGWHDQRSAEHERWVRWHRWHEWHHWHHYGAGYGY